MTSFWVNQMKRLAERVLAAVFPHGPGEKIKRRPRVAKVGNAEVALALKEKKEMPLTEEAVTRSERPGGTSYGQMQPGQVRAARDRATLVDERFLRVEEELNVLKNLLQELDTLSDDKVSIILGGIPHSGVEAKDQSETGNFVDMVNDMILRCQRITRNIIETIARL